MRNILAKTRLASGAFILSAGLHAIRDGHFLASVTFLVIRTVYIFIWDWGYRE